MELDILKVMLGSIVFEVDNLLYTDLDRKKKTCIFCGIKDMRKVSSKFTIPSKVIIEDKKYSIVLVGYEVVLPERVKHLIISEGIAQIDCYSFCNHRFLETVELPDSLNILDCSCFYNCPSLKSVKISENTVVGQYCFWGSNWYNNLMSNAELGEDVYLGKTLIGWKGKKERVVVRSGTEKISIHQDTPFEFLEEIHLPNSIKEVKLFPDHENHLKRLYIEDINSYVSIKYQGEKDSFTNSVIGPVDIYLNNEKTDSIIVDNPVAGIRSYVLYGANIKNLIIGEKVGFINTNSIDNTPIEYLKLPPRISISGEFLSLITLKELHTDYSVKFLSSRILYFSHPNRITIEIDHDFDKEDALNLISLIRNAGSDDITIKTYFYGEKKVDGFIFIQTFINNLTRYLKNIKVFLDREGYKYLRRGIVEYTSHADLYIPEETYFDYCNRGWNTKACLVMYTDNEISYVKDSITGNYKVSCKIDNNGNNSYKGIIRVPETVIVDNEVFNVIGLDNFAFFGCKCIEKIVLPKNMEINPMALLDNENILIERYEEPIN